MLKHLMNGSSLLALALRDADDEGGSDPKSKLREQLAKGNVQKGDDDGKQASDDKSDNESDDGNEEGEEGDEGEDAEGEEEEGEDNDTIKDPPEDETEEEKKAREAKEREEAKLQRKQDRMQRRIDKLVKARETAEAEVERLKAQIAADPDKKLTAEEVESLAEAKAAKKLAEKEAADMQKRFDDDCAKLQKDATKADKQFDDKINELAEDLGPIPSFMIGVLADCDNGGEVLAHIANNDELAEEIWSSKPAKMTRLIVEISTKLSDAKKPPRKQISKVPEPGTPVKANRVVSNTITEADAKNMDVYVAKRQKAIAERRKQQYG